MARQAAPDPDPGPGPSPRSTGTTPEAIATLLATDREAGAVALHAALMTLHESGDARALCALHRLAATYWSADPARVAFHHTHAWVYALEAGDAEATTDLETALALEDRL